MYCVNIDNTNHFIVSQNVARGSAMRFSDLALHLSMSSSVRNIGILSSVAAAPVASNAYAMYVIYRLTSWVIMVYLGQLSGYLT